MCTDFDTLFVYRQYVDYPVQYYFDRKTYAVCEMTSVLDEEIAYYRRYVPLFQIDEESIICDFIMQLNDCRMLRKYIERTVCTEEFLQQNRLWDSWWLYYREAVFRVAEQWCMENSINLKKDVL